MAVDIIARGLGANGLAEANRANTRLDMLPRGMVYIGEVDYYKDLPATAEIGSVYSIKYKGETGTEPSGDEYVWGVYEGTEQWIQIGTSYESLPAQEGGDDLSLVTTGEKYIWNNKQNAITNSNKLDADLVDDSNSSNKFITDEQAEQIETNKNDILSLKNTKQDQNILFTNITVNSNQWVANNDENFPYKAVITLNGIDGTMYPQLTLSLQDSVSGDLAPICETGVNSLTIYSQKEKTITIPVVLITKTLNGIDYSYQINGAGGYTMTIEEVEYTLTPNAQGGNTLTIDLGGSN